MRKVVTMFRESIDAHAEAGQTMAEYATVLGVITLAIVTTISLLSNAVNDAFIRTINIVETVF
jgi:Flp pilus assembly pilin Flp